MTLGVAELSFAFAVFGSVAGVWWRLQSQITANAAKHAEDLAQFRLHVAEKYASHDAMKEALNPLVKELHGLRERLDRFIDRRTE